MNKISPIHSSNSSNNTLVTKIKLMRSCWILKAKGAEAGAKIISDPTNTNSRNSNNNKLTMIIIKAGWPVGGIRKSAKCSAINMRTSSTIRSTKVKITIMTRMVLIMQIKETLKAQEFRLMQLRLAIKALQRIS